MNQNCYFSRILSSTTFSLLFILSTLFTTTLYSAPNYFFPGANYSEHQQSSSEQIHKIEVYLQKQVPGLDASVRDVIDALTEEGMQVYLRGGVIRDLLSCSDYLPKDIDLDYTGQVEDLIAVLEKKKWCYTRNPNSIVVIIGDHRSYAIDAVPVKLNEEASDHHLEFTINNIFYHCNTNSFLDSSKIGLLDLHDDKLRIIAKNWKKWLYRKKGAGYYKLFRFWKMVGKGYIYTSVMQDFFHGETKKIIKTNEQGFTQELIQYLSGHFHSYDDLINGAIAVMGYGWVQDHIIDHYEEINASHFHVQGERDLHTNYRFVIE